VRAAGTSNFVLFERFRIELVMFDPLVAGESLRDGVFIEDRVGEPH
jgi:hypothetical protein